MATTAARTRKSVSATNAVKAVRRLLYEQSSGYAVLPDGGKRVDRDKGIIYGVKVLGRTSPNNHKSGSTKGTEYTLQAMESAVPVIEGMQVNCNHPRGAEEHEDRRVEEGLGQLHNVRATESGVYADLHCLTTHPMWERVAEAAERMPGAYALSINAYGRGDVVDGKYLIRELPREAFRSVDLVRNGGTNRSLFESAKMKRTIRQVVEAAGAGVFPKLRKLLEMGAACGDMEAAEPDAMGAEPDEMDHLFQAFKKMAASDPDKANKILAMLKQECEPNEDEEVEESDDGPDSKKAAGGEDEDEPSKTKESRKGKKPAGPGVRKLQESTVKKLVALAGVKEDARLTRSLLSMGTEDAVLDHLAYLRESAGGPGAAGGDGRGQRPQSSAPGSGRVGATPLKLADVSAALRG